MSRKSIIIENQVLLTNIECRPQCLQYVCCRSQGGFQQITSLQGLHLSWQYCSCTGWRDQPRRRLLPDNHLLFLLLLLSIFCLPVSFSLCLFTAFGTGLRDGWSLWGRQWDWVCKGPQKMYVQIEWVVFLMGIGVRCLPVPACLRQSQYGLCAALTHWIDSRALKRVKVNWDKHQYYQQYRTHY